MANPKQIIKIPRMPDCSVIDCFKKLDDKYNALNIQVSALGLFNQVKVIKINQDPNGILKDIIKHDSSLIEHCSIKLSGLSISYYRGGQSQSNKSPILDEIQLELDPKNGNLSDTDKLDIVALINNDLKAFEPGRFIDNVLSDEQNQVLSIHISTLERLEKLNEDLIKQGSDFRESLEKRFDSKVSKLEGETTAKQEKLDSEHEKRLATLEEKKKTLTDKLNAIDDRNNTHVRREIRDKMLSDVKSRIDKFGVSSATESKRKPVLLGIIFMIVVITLILIYSIFEMQQLFTITSPEKGIGSQNQYWLWVKVTFLSVGLLGTILYYIKWQNRWAEQHANSEFQLQQFYIDVNRANWVIESCLEWRKETDSTIPTALLESITRNLFENNSDELEKVIHPSDELASALLGSASKLKMKVGDSELEFDKPGKIKGKSEK